MKRSNILYLFIAVLSVFSSCSEDVDNYPEPNAGIHGSVIDVTTGKPIQTEEPNGIRIRMIEEKYEDAIPVNFWVRADGTFENSRVFASTYKIIPIEGAFFPADTQVVKISGAAEVNFKVTPFLTIAASVSSGKNSIFTKYSISRSKIGEKIMDCSALVSSYPAVSRTVFDKAIRHDLSKINDDAVLSTQFMDTISNLEGGKTYYVRIEARTKNALNKYNYSPITKITLP